MALIMVSMVLICGAFQTPFFGFVVILNLFCSIFLLSPADKFCSQEFLFPSLVFPWCSVTENSSIQGMQQVRCIQPEDGSKADFRNVAFLCLNVYIKWARWKK
jgi:hypothetical protein